MKRILIIFSILALPRMQAQLCFTDSTYYKNVVDAFSAVSADFNGDGVPDLATADYVLAHISVLLGNGTGGYGSPINYYPNGFPHSITSGDFNGDGIMDIVTANYYSNYLSVFLGSGTGTFSSPYNTNVGSDQLSVIAKDLNTDGKLDLAITTPGGNLAVLLGNGNGMFGPVTNFAISNYPSTLLSGDFNGDGKADLVTGNAFAKTVSVLLGSGTGSFGSAINYTITSSAPLGPIAMCSGDFNGDGKADLATINDSGSNFIWVMDGTGTGSFTNVTSYTLTTKPCAIMSIDLNADGKTDLAVSNRDSGYVSVLSGNGNGTFAAAVNFATGITCFSILSDDLNSDGKIDMVGASSGWVPVFLNCTPTPTCVASVADSLYNISPLNWGIVPHYSSQVTSAVWSWGDGTTTNALYPSHTYSVAGQYNICVTVYTSCGDSASACRNDSIYRMANNSSMVNVNVVPNANGVNQISNSSNQVKVYPNPFTDDLTINFGSNENNTITYVMFDMMGNQIVKENVSLHKGENEFKISPNAIAKGVYFINISDGKKTITLKVVK